MVNYYCFMLSAVNFRRDTKIFRVKVGQSKRDQAKKELVDLYSCDCGCYFRLWDEDTAAELDFKAKTIGLSSFLDVNRLQIIHLSISELYIHIIDGDLDMLQNPPRVVRNFCNLFNRLYSTSIPAAYNLKKSKTRAYLKSKNLSKDETYSLTDCALAYAAIVLLFLLAGYLQGLENSL